MELKLKVLGRGFTLSLCLLSSLYSPWTFAKEVPPPSQRFLGKWYEIATIPQAYQKQCYTDATLEYFQLPEGDLKVLSTCNDQDHQRITAEGRARVLSTRSDLRFSMTYVRFFDWLHFLGTELVVIDSDKSSNYLVMGNLKKKTGWILSRDPILPDTDLKHISAQLKEKGHDPCSFFTQRQNQGISEKVSLCAFLNRQDK